jgi:sugar phosphate isomerase/epimerase
MSRSSRAVKLSLFASAWTFGSTDACLREVEAGHFDGIEAPAPGSASERKALTKTLASRGVPFVAEVCTGGDYAPASSVSFDRHLEDARVAMTHAAEMDPLFVTCLAGSDSWPLDRAIEFFARVMDLARGAGVEISFETHRGRPTFHPRLTADILRALPSVRLTCDFSHWCAVSERLVDDEASLSLAIAHARHVHARVGYAQGPQVPDPRAPEHAADLAAHERWWIRIWTALAERDSDVTMTPEFGPDGYLHHIPFTNAPVADLTTINRWMAKRLRERFDTFLA